MEHEVDFSTIASNILMRVLHLKTQDRETTSFVPGSVDFLAKIAAPATLRIIFDQHLETRTPIFLRDKIPAGRGDFLIILHPGKGVICRIYAQLISDGIITRCSFSMKTGSPWSLR